MSSENPSSAVNQQERLVPTTWLSEVASDLGNYIAGFVDGEGSFNVPIRRVDSRTLPFRVGLSFNVSQIGPDAPTLLEETFGVGTVRDRGDGVHYFEVTRVDQLQERVFPFFDRFPLRTSKSRDLETFREITTLVSRREHLTREGVTKIVRLRSPMNRGGKRRRTDEEILAALEA